MKNLTLGLIIFFALNTILSAQDRTWQTFTPVNGDWTILAPGVMQPDENALKQPKKKATYAYKDSESFFAVSYRELPRMPKHLDRYYNQTRDHAVKGVEGKLIKEKEFTANGFTGREIYVQINSSIERTRMFFHSKRFYVIIAILPEEEIESEPINAFMNSFAVADIDLSKR